MEKKNLLQKDTMSFLIIKTIFKMTKVGKFIRRVALGVKDVILPNFSANRAAQEGGKGKLDYVRLVTSIIMLVLVVGFLFGKVTMENLMAILEFLK